MAILPGSDPAAVQAAAQRLADGGLVAFATETVYGLGARADDDAAVAAIFAAKGRPADHPLIVHVADLAAAQAFAATLDGAAMQLVQHLWPGPLTLIVPRRAGVAPAAAGGQQSIGLRMPSHPVAHALLQAAARLGVAGVAAPSANRFGRISPTTAAHVAAEFGPGLMVLDGGPCQVGIESAIVDCTRSPPALLRPGQLGRPVIEQVLGLPLGLADAASPRAPGTLASHYAPSVPLRLLQGDELASLLRGPVHEGAGTVGVYSRLEPGAGAGWVWRQMPGDAAAVAHELFAVLRELDAAGVSAIWVERPPAGPQWDGVLDRLRRAAA